MPARPLTQQEIQLILRNMPNPRNKCLLLFGLRTGFRIGELLSITVQDVVQYSKIKDSVTVNRKNMKGKVSGRTVVLHSEVKSALEQMNVLNMDPKMKLFPISRMQASRVFKEAVNKAQIEGKVSTHSMRKTYAQRMYEKLGKDLRKTQLATGHKNLNSLAFYLQANQEEVDKAILED